MPRIKLILTLFLVLLGTGLLHTQVEQASPGDQGNYIENIHLQASEESVTISWNLLYPALEQLQANDARIALRYNLKLDQERYDKGYSSSGWETIENIPISVTRYIIPGLKESKEYVFQIGMQEAGETRWSESYSIKVKDKWGLFELFVLLGSIALFLYGMKTMSDGLQQATGKRLRHVLGSITSNRFKGILTGLGITTLVQSSSVTTIMTVSFVNAGILTLMQAAGVIMGANIGTTVTAWLIDIFGFKVDIGPYTLILLAIGIPLLFFRNPKLKSWANVIIGFAILFLGLGFIKSSVPEVGPESQIVSFFIGVNNIKYFSTIIAVLFGTFLTVIIQSSSATVALTMALMASGIIPFEVGAAMILGENIGTTITAELAASVGNVHAKRAARIHSSFNIFGVILALIFFPFFLDLVIYLTETLFDGNPLTNTTEYGSTGLAVLHSTFNIANTFIMVWFIPYLVRFATYTVKPKGEKDEQFQLEYIGAGMNMTPELSIQEVKKELAKFGDITSRMSGFATALLSEANKEKQEELIERISKYEEITDNVELEIANYLNKIAGKNVDEMLARRISGMNRIITNLERIGDIYYQLAKLIEKRNEKDIVFSELQNRRLHDLVELVDKAFAEMNKNLNLQVEQVSIQKAQEIEDSINAMRDEVRGEYYQFILREDSNNQIAGDLIYNNIFNLLERVGDHIINVTEGILGKVQ